MADLELPDTLGIVEQTFRVWAPGQTNLTAPNRPALYSSGPKAFKLSGQVSINSKASLTAGSSAQDAWHDADADLLSFLVQLRGNRHRVKLEFPVRYRMSPPADASAVLAQARESGDDVIATITPTDFGSWTPEPGRFISIGERAYLVVSVSGNDLTLAPGALPLATVRPPGLRVTPGGEGRVVTFVPPSGTNRELVIWLPAGFGAFRHSLYTAWHNDSDDRDEPVRLAVYWIDIEEGRRGEVINAETEDVVYGSVGTAYGGMYAVGNLRTDSTKAFISRLEISLADPEKNSVRQVVELTAAPGKVTAMASWEGPADDSPRLYVGVAGKLYRSLKPLDNVDAKLTEPWTTWFEEVPNTTFTKVDGLSPGPRGDDSLYVLDTGSGFGFVYAWDGAVQEEYASAGGGNTDSDAPSLHRMRGVEWYRGVLYFLSESLGHADGTHTPSGLRVLNATPASALDVELHAPFVWARLSGNAATGPTGSSVPATSFTWTEVGE